MPESTKTCKFLQTSLSILKTAHLQAKEHIEFLVVLASMYLIVYYCDTKEMVAVWLLSGNVVYNLSESSVDFTLTAQISI